DACPHRQHPRCHRLPEEQTGARPNDRRAGAGGYETTERARLRPWPFGTIVNRLSRSQYVMKRSTSTFFLVLAVLNILVAVIPPCVGGFGAASFMSETKININNRELGPELEKHIAKEAPLAKVEAFVALAMNIFCCLLLIGGAVGLFMSQTWARWLSIAAGLLFILTLLVHDIYQIFFYRPVLMRFIDLHVPAQGVLADGIKFGTTVSVLMWSCTNPL